jgi:hypothetical protein
MSNVIVQQEFHFLDETLALRHQLLDMLTDEDLAYTLPHNKSLGALCREIAEIEVAYVESFKTFKMDWGYKAHNAAELEKSVDALRRTFAEQEKAFKDAIAALSDEIIENTVADRGGFKPPLRMQFHIYREGLLIFYAKVSIYLRALQKELPEQWRSWIG